MHTAPTGRTLALRKVDAVGQYHSNMRSSTALSQSHDTTRGVGCPILATQPSPPTQSPTNTQCSVCPPNGAPTGRTLALRKVDAAGQQHGDMRSAAALSQRYLSSPGHHSTAHITQTYSTARGNWASRWNVARVLLSWRSGLFYRPDRDSGTQAAQPRGPSVSRRGARSSAGGLLCRTGS